MPDSSSVHAFENATGREDTALSELADGELNPQDAARLIESLSRSVNRRECWESYHVVGDCLRGIPPLKSSLASRISELLADEPTILAPQRRSLSARFAMPAAASLAAMVLVAWGVVNFNQNSGTPQASSQMAAISADQSSPGVREDVNGYVVAHRDFSPGAMIANAAFELPPESDQ